jgi:ATP-dependent DNA helicase PIF1
LQSNAEQSLAFSIVAEHVLSKSPIQLLLHLSGMAGTGKTHVIKTIIKFFNTIGRSNELLVSASTGMAAVLISGHTIHSLTFLPKQFNKNLKLDSLQQLWSNVSYLIIDEISMVSADLLADISHRLHMAKYGANSAAHYDKPFGGINVIFTGDLGQLKPVNSTVFFSNNLVKNLHMHTIQSLHGQSKVLGAFLWRQIDSVVELKLNMRQNLDKPYASLLERIRTGISANDDAQLTSDYTNLLLRQLGVINAKQPLSLASFADAPIIVTRRSARDKINFLQVQVFALRTHQEFAVYHSSDKHSGSIVPQELQERLWQIPSSASDDAIGRLPLVVGMRIMITENIAIQHKVVNGMQGTVLDIKYNTDHHGNRIALMAYIHVPDSHICAPNLHCDVVPISPTQSSFTYRNNELYDSSFSIRRSQLPLIPAFCLTDYKAQGQSMDKAIIDLASARGKQSVYVMLSRVKTFQGLAILRHFDRKKLEGRMSEELRNEFTRLADLADHTKSTFINQSTSILPRP